MLGHEIIGVYVLGSFYELVWFLEVMVNSSSVLWSVPHTLPPKETPAGGSRELMRPRQPLPYQLSSSLELSSAASGSDRVEEKGD